MLSSHCWGYATTRLCHLLLLNRSELVPHNWKFVVIVLVAIPNVIPSGFGGYLGIS